MDPLDLIRPAPSLRPARALAPPRQPAPHHQDHNSITSTTSGEIYAEDSALVEKKVA
jgi:hypothetical protein